MKIALVFAAVVLGGCAAPGGEVAAPPPAVVTPSSDVVALERVPFVVGVSSTTVEKLGKVQGCTSARGAGLVTEAGPVEVYRMQCDSGAVFMARCELRQCRKM